MTISNTTVQVAYNGNGSTTAFAVTPQVRAASEIQVILVDTNGEETVQTLTTDYTLTGIVTVNMLVAPASGEKLVIRRVTPVTQLADYTPNGRFPSSSHEDVLDKITQVQQEHAYDLRRTIKVKKSNSTDLDLELINTSPDTCLRWDDTGTKVIAGPTVTAIENAETLSLASAASAAAALASENAAAASAFEAEQIVIHSPISVEYTGQLFEAPAVVQFTPSTSVERLEDAVIDQDNTLKHLAFLLYREDTGTDLGVVELSFPDVGSIFGTLTIADCGKLTSLSFPELRYLSSGSIGASAPNITTFLMPKLKTVQVNFTPSLGNVTTFNLMNLVSATEGFTPTVSSLTSLSLPNLTYVGGTFGGTSSFPLVASMDLSGLKVIGNWNATQMGALTSLNLPSLEKFIGSSANTMNITAAALLTSYSTPALVTSRGAISLTGTALANVTLGTVGILKRLLNVTITGAALTSTSVNNILILLASLDGTNGTTLWGAGRTVNLSGGTSATHSGAGSAARTTLLARGATVTTN
jgi:hypothetical protein